MNKNNKKWRELYGKINDKCDDVELLYRLCAMEKFVEYNGKNFKIPNYNNSIRELIDDFAEQAFRFDETEIDKYKTKLEKFIELLDMSKIYFQRKALLEGFFVVYEKTDIPVRRITDEICEKILDDKYIKNTQKGGTISGVNMNTRWKRIYEILSDDR